MGTQLVDKAAIFNSEGTSVWAATPGFKINPAELKEVVGSYSDTGAFKNIQSTGFHIAGEKFITLKADDRSIYGKKVCQDRAPLIYQTVLSPLLRLARDNLNHQWCSRLLTHWTQPPRKARFAQ